MSRLISFVLDDSSCEPRKESELERKSSKREIVG